MKRRFTPSFFLAIMVILLWSVSALAVPHQMTYTGYLEKSGKPFNSGAAPLTVTFKIYSSASGGYPLWSETIASVTVTGGVFTVVLGKTIPLNSAILDGKPHFMEIDLGKQTMNPRIPLRSVPYAFTAENCTGDITPKSLSVGGNTVIDQYGKWVGSASGLKGDKGDTGAQGLKGDKGDTGAQGLKGDKGDTGAQGLKGDKGDTGAQGIKGDKGLKGDKGDKGDSWNIPGGAIMMFQTACPTGWTRLSALDNRFPRGASTYGGKGGGDTHTHSAGSLSGPNHNHTFKDTVSMNTSTNGSHAHSVNSHSHTLSSHSHSLNSHTHTCASHAHGDGSLYAAIGTVGNNYLGFAPAKTLFNASMRAGTTNQQSTMEGMKGVEVNGVTSSGGGGKSGGPSTASTGSAGSGSTGGSSPGTTSAGNHFHGLSDYTASGTTSLSGTGKVSGSTASAGNVPAYLTVVYCVKN